MLTNNEQTTLELDTISELNKLFKTHSIDETRINLSKSFFNTINSNVLETDFETQTALQSYIRLQQLLTIVETGRMPVNVNALTLEITL